MSPKELDADEIERIYHVKTFILNNLHRRFTVAELARMAAMNEKKFNDSFHFLFDYHVGPYIHEARMQLAKFLLVHTNKPIKEIAVLTGFSYPKNFTKAFHHYFKRTAVSFRKNG